MNADHSGSGAHCLLSRHGAHNRIIAVNRRGNAATQTGGDTSMLAGGLRPGRVAQVTGHEEVLIGSGTRKRRNWRHQGRFRGRTVGDSRDVGDLDDVRSASEHGRSDRVCRLPCLASIGEGAGFFAVAGSLLLG